MVFVNDWFVNILGCIVNFWFIVNLLFGVLGNKMVFEYYWWDECVEGKMN